jgi:hypothetical protein
MGTERYNRAREVARVPEQFLDKVKGSVAKQVPDVVNAIDQHDTAVSALLRVQNVLEQRVLKAKSAGTGEGAFGRFVHAVTHPKATIAREGAAFVGKQGVRLGRAADRVSRYVQESENPYLQKVLEGMTNGLPLAAAAEAAEGIGRAGATEKE